MHSLGTLGPHLSLSVMGKGYIQFLLERNDVLMKSNDD
jgi:hypothetical protein